MSNARPEENVCQGVRFHGSRDTAIRQLRRSHHPSGYGHRVWNSCWLLMDYLKTLNAPPGPRVLEVGCGWGLAGIFCAKNLHASVTCVDADPAVFPFLRLHAELNRVSIATMHKRYEDLTAGDMQGTDLLIGADICFWEEMPEQVIPMIDLALSSGVGLILIADPGRSTFERLAAHCQASYGASTYSLAVRRPRAFSGRILKIPGNSMARH